MRGQDESNGFGGEFFREIVELIVTKILETYSAKADALLATAKLHLQILTLLLCPDPSAHPAVWNSCFVPLIGDALGQATRDRLQTLYDVIRNPRDWGTITAAAV
ncbi:MAG: hypothetical protein LBK42_12735 [Propionibacteriaceae bacterium]|jgi:hypothetical protein|nr:hypothetical protein [Propionibacteriaceae bacterium]